MYLDEKSLHIIVSKDFSDLRKSYLTHREIKSQDFRIKQTSRLQSKLSLSLPFLSGIIKFKSMTRLFYHHPGSSMVLENVEFP